MRRILIAWSAAALVLSTAVVATDTTPDETADGWFAAGARTAQARIGDSPGRARNVILFVGDGMGLSTVTAARILAGQRQGGLGEDHLLSFEQLPYSALAKTYAVDAQIADSAPTMTAMMTGVKTRTDMVSVGPAARTRDCASAQGHALLTLLELAEIAGMGTGIITTTRVSHATPAASYAHSSYRRWEADSELDEATQATGCHDIARQLLEFPFGDGPDVVMGGGRSRFTPSAVADPEYPELRGLRADGRDLTAEWSARGEGAEYFWNRAQFDAIDPDRTHQLLALFEPEHLRYEHDRAADPAGEPSLAEMVDTALDLLQRQAHGYVLIIESGLIDRAHHDGIAWRALNETVAMAAAVQRAIDRTDPANTLLIVTADHSHPLTLAGYVGRGNPIAGLARDVRGGPMLDAQGLPFTTLGYANGPGHRSPRIMLDATEVSATDYRHEAAIPSSSVPHAGEDVPVYARGPGAQAVRGVIEQNVIYHLLVQNTPLLRETQCRLTSACDTPDAVTRRPDHGLVLRQQPNEKETHDE